MQNIFRISSAQLIEALIHGVVICLATFLVGFFGGLDSTDFFVNLTPEIAIQALKDGVNSMWHLLYAAVIPLLVNIARWDKK